MPWFISMLLICLLFLAVAFVASEKMIGRDYHSKVPRRGEPR